jgi:hypothetical protein
VLEADPLGMASGQSNAGRQQVQILFTPHRAAADEESMAIIRRSSHAGVYAEQRYQRGLQSWRRNTRSILALVCGPFLVGGLTVLVLDGHGFSWSAGAVFGAFAGIWIAIRESPPRYVEQWQHGAEGERKTEKALRALEREGWSIRHDIQLRHGNYDHIAVGPSGVYLLETKNLQGVVEIRDGVPRLNRRHDPEASVRFERIRPYALGSAAHIKDDIEQRTGHCTWVQAVIVFWSEFPEQLAEDGPCVYVHGSRLRAWLRERPVRLDGDDVSRIVAAVESL